MGIRNYTNTGQTSTLTAGIGATDTTFTLINYVGDPTPPFTAALARGTATEEVILVTAVSGSTVTVTRGYDSTSAQAQGAGATFQEVVVAQDYREANTHVNATSAGAHGATSQLVGVSDVQTLTNKTLTTPSLSSPTLTGTSTVATMNVTTLTVSGVTTLGVTTTTTLTASGLITANNGVTVPTGKKITLTDAPALGTDAANKTYVDATANSAASAAAAAVTLTSDKITDAASAATASVIVKRDAAARAQFADPAVAQDAATKHYVDGRLKTASFSGTTNASGVVTITHGFGATPSVVSIQSTTAGAREAGTYAVISKTSTTFQVKCYYNDVAGPGPNANAAVTFDWIAFA